MENTMKTKKAEMWVLMTAAAMAVGMGCSSNKDKHAKVDESADTSAQNHGLIRMALAENIYNGIATERTVYSKDFDPGHTDLNELGMRRVETLISAARGGSGQIVVLQGDAPEPLYTARVASVRRQLADAGINLKDVTAVKGTLVDGETTASGRTLLAFDKMISTYQAKPEGQQQNVLTIQPAGQPSSSHD
jgi:hypothetical protein